MTQIKTSYYVNRKRSHTHVAFYTQNTSIRPSTSTYSFNVTSFNYTVFNYKSSPETRLVITKDKKAMGDSDDFVINLREPKISEIEELHKMVVDSTSGGTKVSISSLINDLFGPEQDDATSKAEVDDSCFEFDVELINSNRNPVQAFVAELDSKIVGFVLFHYHYSPWEGHGSFVDKVYISPTYRRRGKTFDHSRSSPHTFRHWTLTNLLFIPIN